MAPDVTSQHLGSSAELTVIMPIKAGFVDVRDARTYATRLRILLRTLNAIRKRGVEREPFRTLSGPVERIRTIKEIRWLIFDNDTKLLLAVSFDRPWEPYIRKIARDAGPVLDAILCNCEGYTENKHASEYGYAGFAAWVRKYQQEADFYYTGEPYQTVEDAAYLEALEQTQRNNSDLAKFERQAARLTAPDPAAEAKKAQANDPRKAVAQGLQTLHTMFRMTELFPAPRPGVDNRDHIYLLKLAKAILHDFDATRINPVPLRHQRALDWLGCEPPGYALPANPDPKPTYAPDDVQGNIITGFKGMTHSCLLLMRITDASRFSDFLKRDNFLERLTRESSEGIVSGMAINLAFTFQGLRTLGMPEGTLATFPREFREGMEARGAMLGDVRSNHHDNWTLPRWSGNDRRHPDFETIRLSTVDLVVKLQIHSAEKGDCLPAEFAEERDRLAAIEGLELLCVEPLWRYRDKVGGKNLVREHFGFVDGLSQPTVSTGENPEHEGRYRGDHISRGELLLGYRNANGDPLETSELLHNGSFEVIRKLKQNVKALNGFLDLATEDLRGKRKAAMIDTWKSKMMGRDTEGVPATNRSLRNTSNAFTYENDAGGARCPFQAHIRRANPRTSVDGQPVPRIMRRGFSYGPLYAEDPQADRGLMFMAYNASIAEQFEVIQRWISGGNSTGIASAQFDPFLGVPAPHEPHNVKFLHRGSVVRGDLSSQSADGKPDPFVTLEWGMYLFVPSISALAELDRFRKPSSRELDDQIEDGEATITKLTLLASLNDEAATLALWKQLLEDLSSKQAGKATNVWAAIRHNHDGVLDTPYGVLIARNDQVMEVFANNETFSVREYWHRMKASIGEIYLGMDPNPQPMPVHVKRAKDIEYELRVTAGDYAEQTTPVNDVIYYSVDERQAFDLTRKTTASVLTAWFEQAPTPTAVDLRQFFADRVLAELSRAWFGLPDGAYMKIGGVPENEQDVHCPYHFLAPSRYIFPPNPTGFVSTLAQDHGARLLEQAKNYVAHLRSGKPEPTAMLKAMFPDILDPDTSREREDYFARTLVGVMHGFFPTSYGNFLSVMARWMRDESLWRLQQSLSLHPQGDEFAGANAVLRDELITAMLHRPVPETLHRTAVADTTLNGQPIPAGKRIVVGVMSGCHEQLEQGILSAHTVFGGDYCKKATGGAPVHACPGQPMAMGVLIGMISGLLEFGMWKPSRVPLVLEVGQR